jgi:hypothetical protein
VAVDPRVQTTSRPATGAPSPCAEKKRQLLVK